MDIPWILIAVGGVLVILLALLLFLKKGKRYPTDYYAIFIMGICFMPLGLTMDNHFFFILGLIYMALGLANKDKWKKNHKTWDKLDKDQRKMMLLLIGLLVLLVLAGFVAFFFVAR